MVIIIWKYVKKFRKKNKKEFDWCSLVKCEDKNHEGNPYRIVGIYHLKKGLGIKRCNQCALNKNLPKYRNCPRKLSTRRKIAVTLRGRKDFKKTRLKKKLSAHKGKDHWNWNANLSDQQRQDNKRRGNQIKLRDFRYSVFKKDNFICQSCGIYGGKLRVHHIQNFCWDIKNRYNVENGITLCEECHNDFHNEYGIKNNDLLQLKNFLEEND